MSKDWYVVCYDMAHDLTFQYITDQETAKQMFAVGARVSTRPLTSFDGKEYRILPSSTTERNDQLWREKLVTEGVVVEGAIDCG